jgi:L-2-hydroxyglutarate oxidase LhgO
MSFEEVYAMESEEVAYLQKVIERSQKSKSKSLKHLDESRFPSVDEYVKRKQDLGKEVNHV